jgi:4-hydroxybenzoate polyprenyltransferase
MTTAEATEVALPDSAAQPRAMRLVTDLLTLLRPRQWAKNLMTVPLALLDAPPLWTVGLLGRVGWAVLLFVIVSALVYVVNDIADRELDRHHPLKSHRPIAAGRIPVALAWCLAGALTALLTVCALHDPAATWPVWVYLAVNIVYSRWLKHLPLVDICVVAGGFGLRVLLGYEATGGGPSGWLLTAVFAVCLVLIVGKRRHELSMTGAAHRPALRGYNLALADHLLGLNAALALIASLLYLRFDAQFGTHRDTVLMMAVPLALFGVFRYLQAVLVLRSGGDPIRTVLRDRLIMGAAGLLAAVVCTALVATHLTSS